MTITGQSSLDKDAIDQMVKDAEAHAEEDRRRREEAEVRNNADTLVYQTEKLLREQGDKVSGDEKAAVESARGAEGRPSPAPTSRPSRPPPRR
jgi:molecular chaperone DnaK